MKQLCASNNGPVYLTEILSGPHEWTVGNLAFQTVLVKAAGDKPGTVSMIETVCGLRIATIKMRVAKSRPNEGLIRSSEEVTKLIAKYGEARLADRISNAQLRPVKPEPI